MRHGFDEEIDGKIVENDLKPCAKHLSSPRTVRREERENRREREEVEKDEKDGRFEDSL